MTVSDSSPMVGRRHLIGQLAGYEGQRLISTPGLWLAMVGSLALTVFLFEGEPATLDFRSVMIAGGCLPLAATSLILGHQAAGRDRTSRVGELADTPATSRDRRILGTAAAVWAPLLLTIPVLALGVGMAISDDPAGSWNVVELLTGPLVVVVAHVFGVALGRWLPNPLVPALALVMMVGLFLIPNLGFGSVVPAPSPLLPWSDPYTDWVQGEPRLPVVHLVYLVGLVGVAVTVAVRRWRWLAVALVILIGAAAMLSRLEVGGEAVVASVARWEAEQTVVCEVLGEVTYCAIDGYQAWIGDWAGTVERIQQLVPYELQLAEVRQTTRGGSFFDADPTVAHVAGRWDGTGSGDALSLTEQVLAPELGLPGTYGETAELDRGLPECMAGTMPFLASGQARGVGLVVLAVMSVPGAVDPGLVFGDSAQFGQIELSAAEGDLARRVVNLPETEVLDRLHARWDQLVDPETTSAQLADWFDEPAPTVLPTSAYDAMTCQCSGESGFQCSSEGP